MIILILTFEYSVCILKDNLPLHLFHLEVHVVPVVQQHPNKINLPCYECEILGLEGQPSK